MATVAELVRRTYTGRLLLRLARGAESVLQHSAQLATLFWRVVRVTASGQVTVRDIAGQMYWMGVQSLPIVLITSMLSGVVTSQ